MFQTCRRSRRQPPRRYYPLTIFSYQLEHQLFGYEPHYHLNNLFLHFATPRWFLPLVFLDLPVFTAAAALFWIHPLQGSCSVGVGQRIFCQPLSVVLLVYARASV